MNKCPNCSATLDNEAFCPFCGTKVSQPESTPLVCPSCNTPVGKGSFCTKCGCSIKGNPSIVEDIRKVNPGIVSYNRDYNYQSAEADALLLRYNSNLNTAIIFLVIGFVTVCLGLFICIYPLVASITTLRALNNVSRDNDNNNQFQAARISSLKSKAILIMVLSILSIIFAIVMITLLSV